MEGSASSWNDYRPVYDEATAENLASDFARLAGECYVDHAGATLHSDSQIRRVADDLKNSLYANPHSVGTAGVGTHDAIERMRYRVLEHFNTTSEEYSVIFTSGTTHSLKIVAESFAFSKNDADSGTGSGHFVHTQDNHTSVLGMREIVARRGAKVSCVGFEEIFEIFRNPSSSTTSEFPSNSLFVYPAQCNFSGLKFPLRWIKDTHNGALSVARQEYKATRWFVLLDAAAYVATNHLDLSQFTPDFVCLSFYKMFGYPTGIGALLVKNSSADVLEKVYYGGGTVDVSLSSKMFHVKRSILHQRFEDGTVPFLSLVSLRHGFDTLSKLTMKKISNHVFSLAKHLHHSLLMLHHRNGAPVVKLYSDTHHKDCQMQGGIVTFNLMRSSGEYIGYMEVLHMSALFKIHLRTGCFCNPGACQRHLSLTNQEVLQNYDAGYVCGGSADIINGKPTGAVRISFGYMSTIKDVETILKMVYKCFVDEPRIEKTPDWWANCKSNMLEKRSHHSIINGSLSNNGRHETIIRNNNHEANNIENEIPHKYSNKTDMKLYQEENCGKMTLQRLFIYPIKSCGAYEITGTWTLSAKGLQYDREWMIITSAGVCLTQKQNVNMCLIQPIICIKKKTMTLAYPGMPPIEVPLEHAGKHSVEGLMCRSKVCGHKVEGIDCGSDVSEWLSLALHRPNLRLIRQSNNETNNKETGKPDLTFSSQAQYLLLNEASIQWLIDRISEDSDLRRGTVLHRFRGNVIVEGCPPFQETRWKYIRIGNNGFMVNGPCTRCQMICIDQTTGKKTVEPLRTLAEEFHGKLRFGIYLSRQTKKEGMIKIGDSIYCE